MEQPFSDRSEAGKALTALLRDYAGRNDVLVLALPRGGVPVALEVARGLRVPLDVFLVRKLGTPGGEELAMGALAEGGVRVLNERIVQGLHIPPEIIERVAEREGEELERRARLYRGSREPPDPRDRAVIVVDDGLATGATMRVAVRALRAAHPHEIVVAVPVAPPETCEALREEADHVVVCITPAHLASVGSWYLDFEQVTDAEVQDLLALPPDAEGSPS